VPWSRCPPILTSGAEKRRTLGHNHCWVSVFPTNGMLSMAQVRCRCGETLNIPPDGPDRIVCPRCAAKIRVRRSKQVGDIDGFIRFSCPCGRRLKVRASGSPEAGKCPDCGRVVPVPDQNTASRVLPSDPEAVTEELSPEEVARLERWAQERLAQASGKPAPPPTPPSIATATPGTKMEAGLRVCPSCGRPVHLGATICRHCNAHVPKR
jgi:endogenous inhibitor of DNA gyrase (YacG/DUF329 family)